MTMHDGERVPVRGSSGTPYELSRDGTTYACSCPAWRKQKVSPEKRSCAHLRAHLGDAHEDARVDPGSDRIAAALAQAHESARVAPVDPPEVRAEREAAVATALARFPAVAAKMRAVYDMPLPGHLAHAAGFWLGLTPDEREEAQVFLGPGLAGVGDWFEAESLSRIAINDERLWGRHRRDPPEFVTVFSGTGYHGSHWGLWYDDPRELPRQIAHNDAKDDGKTTLCKPTLLATLRGTLISDNFKLHALYARSIVAWLDENIARELAAHRDEKILPPFARTRECTGGPDPVVPGARPPADFSGQAAQQARLATYRGDPAKTLQWIDQALKELEAGQPMRALFLARELHWLAFFELREEGADLGMRAYQAIGRTALAEVLRVHNHDRDLHDIDIYE